MAMTTFGSATCGAVRVTLLAGDNTAGHPAGTKTGDVIHVFQSGSIQMITDVSIDPAGNVWAANNWNSLEAAARRESVPSDLDLGRRVGLHGHLRRRSPRAAAAHGQGASAVNFSKPGRTRRIGCGPIADGDSLTVTLSLSEGRGGPRKPRPLQAQARATRAS